MTRLTQSRASLNAVPPSRSGCPGLWTLSRKWWSPIEARQFRGRSCQARANGFKTRNEIMDFHSRKLVFIDGPEGVTVELSEWH